MVNVINGHFSRCARQSRGREFCFQSARDYALSRLKRGIDLRQQGRRRSFSAGLNFGFLQSQNAPCSDHGRFNQRRARIDQSVGVAHSRLCCRCRAEFQHRPPPLGGFRPGDSRGLPGSRCLR